ncbi:MAG: hypothetical protein IPN94_19460 [Sphingobacteriales bacterium]|nr:hypothetical protein [Sphingobacteriales bacterium]
MKTINVLLLTMPPHLHIAISLHRHIETSPYRHISTRFNPEGVTLL